MIQISDAVRPPDAFSFQSGRHPGAGMMQNTIPNFPGQIQAQSVILQLFYHPQALLIVPKPSRQQIIQRPLSDMSVWRMPQIMPERDGFGQVFVETKSAGDSPRDLCNLQRVGQTRTVMIPFR